MIGLIIDDDVPCFWPLDSVLNESVALIGCPGEKKSLDTTAAFSLLRLAADMFNGRVWIKPSMYYDKQALQALFSYSYYC